MAAPVDSQAWDQLVLAAGGTFLQSYAWGEFQRAYGRPVDRWYHDGVALQTMVYTLPAGRAFLFTPYGPVGQLNAERTVAVLDTIERLAKKYQAIFWRYERGGEQYGGQPVSEVHPATTWLTPLREPQAMLSTMKQKWRYNIRLAERKGVHVTSSLAIVDVDRLYALLQQTARRQRIRLHPKSYYQLMMDVLGRQQCAQLYFAEYQQNIVAAALVIRFGNITTYLHGGSDYQHRAVMASHLLHWRILCDAYAAGSTTYDWFGIAPPDIPDHPFAQLTRFKQGFGGASQNCDGTYELPLQRTWYNAYRLVKRSRIWISS